MPSMVSGRVGVRGNKTHLVFRDKVGANDRGLSLRPHESRLPPGHFTVALTISLSLPGLTGQSSTPGGYL
jgi:hypothetical protein